MSYLDSCIFEHIVNIKSFNKVSFMRNTCPTISSLYYKLIKCLWQTTLVKVDITEKSPLNQFKN